MTHDELSKKLEGLWHDSFKAPGYQALRAVVELHKPVEFSYLWFGKANTFIACDICYIHRCKETYVYPCPTIQAIEKELG